jgi:hypothetical protein
MDSEPTLDVADYADVLLPYEHPGTLVPRLAAPFLPFGSILDVGAPGTLGFDAYVSAGVSPTAMHRLDVFPPATTPPNFHLANAFDAVALFGAKSFDAVQCAEMIEHCERADGERLFAVLEALARRFVVLTTPCCWLEQDPAKNPDAEWARNPYQKHLSAWYPEDFTSRGYRILLNGGIHADGVSRSVCGSQIVAWKSP